MKTDVAPVGDEIKDDIALMASSDTPGTEKIARIRKRRKKKRRKSEEEKEGEKKRKRKREKRRGSDRH